MRWLALALLAGCYVPPVYTTDRGAPVYCDDACPEQFEVQRAEDLVFGGIDEMPHTTIRFVESKSEGVAFECGASSPTGCCTGTISVLGSEGQEARIYIAYQENHCIGGTALAHEYVHLLRHRLDDPLWFEHGGYWGEYENFVNAMLWRETCQ